MKLTIICVFKGNTVQTGEKKSYICMCIYMFGCADFTHTHTHIYIRTNMTGEPVNKAEMKWAWTASLQMSYLCLSRWLNFCIQVPKAEMFAPPFPCTWVFSSLEWWLDMCVTRLMPDLSIWGSWLLEQDKLAQKYRCSGCFLTEYDWRQ